MTPPDGKEKIVDSSSHDKGHRFKSCTAQAARLLRFFRRPRIGGERLSFFLCPAGRERERIVGPRLEDRAVARAEIHHAEQEPRGFVREPAPAEFVVETPLKAGQGLEDRAGGRSDRRVQVVGAILREVALDGDVSHAETLRGFDDRRFGQQPERADEEARAAHARELANEEIDRPLHVREGIAREPADQVHMHADAGVRHRPARPGHRAPVEPTDVLVHQLEHARGRGLQAELNLAAARLRDEREKLRVVPVLELGTADPMELQAAALDLQREGAQQRGREGLVGEVDVAVARRQERLDAVEPLRGVGLGGRPAVVVLVVVDAEGAAAPVAAARGQADDGDRLRENTSEGAAA